MTKIAILGGGQIGEALTSGLVASGFAGSDITVTNRTESRSQELKETYGVNVTSDNAAAVDGADYIFACVKPYAILDLLEGLEPAKDAVVVSMAAGLTPEQLQGRRAKACRWCALCPIPHVGASRHVHLRGR